MIRPLAASKTGPSTEGEPNVNDVVLTRWSLCGLEPESFRLRDDGTLAPQGDADEPTTVRGLSVWALPRVMENGATLAQAEFEVADIIGRGGMGEVRLARQTSLNRLVAVKVLHRNDRLDERAVAMMSEARTMGALEHPNIVPVYMLGADTDGRPAIVMKRIEGTPWNEFIAPGPDRTCPPGAAEDPLDWHLRVLMQVCDAVHFAHERGVLHRDLKMENVMIGRHAEVYLLDWGLAAALRPDTGLPLPLASAVRQVVGTPKCVAPEMVLLEGGQMGPATDVYQLGCALHTVLTGDRRHAGVTVVEMMYAAAASRPAVYAAGVSTMLGEIANKATSRLAADRHPTALALKAAIAEYLRVRGSLALSGAASSRVPEIVRLVADDTLLDRPTKLHHLFGECRFGFEAALKQWPENREALVGLRRVRVEMLAHAVQTANVEQAQVLLREIKDPPQQLVDELGALRERKAAQARRVADLEQMAHDMDLAIHSRVRSRIMVALAFFWGALYTLLAVLARTGSDVDAIGYPMFFVLIGLHTGATVGLTLLLRRQLWTSALNRRFVLTLQFTYLAPLMLWPMAHHLALPLVVALALLNFCFAMSCVVAAVAIDARILLAAAIFAVAYVALPLYPARVWEIMAATTFNALLYIGWIWRVPVAKRRP